MAEDYEKPEVYLKQIAQDIKHVRQLLVEAVNSLREAESEIPEKMRRFVMYMHDVHDIKNMYEERGLSVPPHVLREMERCDDRYRHLLDELHLDGGAFDKVRREMAGKEGNRWDHTRLLPKGDCS